MLCTFSFGCFQIYQNKSAKNIAVHFIGTIVPIKCMPKISAVGLFCLDKFENNQTRTCTTFFRTSKLTELYFNPHKIFIFFKIFTWYKVNFSITKAYFIDPDLICGEGRTQAEFDAEGTGNKLVFLNGSTLLEAPLNLDDSRLPKNYNNTDDVSTNNILILKIDIQGVSPLSE